MREELKRSLTVVLNSLKLKLVMLDPGSTRKNVDNTSVRFVGMMAIAMLKKEGLNEL